MFKKKNENKEKQKNKIYFREETYYKRKIMKDVFSWLLLLFLFIGSASGLFRSFKVPIDNENYRNDFVMEYIQKQYFFDREDVEQTRSVKEDLQRMSYDEVQSLKYNEKIKSATVSDTAIRLYTTYQEDERTFVVSYKVKQVQYDLNNKKKTVTFQQQIKLLKNGNGYLVLNQPKPIVFYDYYVSKEEKEKLKKQDAENKTLEQKIDKAKDSVSDAEKSDVEDLITSFLKIWSTDLQQATVFTKDCIYPIDKNIVFNVETISYKEMKKTKEEIYVVFKVSYTQKNITFEKEYMFTVRDKKIIEISERRGA